MYYRKYKTFNEISPKTKKILRTLTLSTGMMWDTANWQNPETVVAYKDGVPVGWAIVANSYQMHIFVNRDYRKQGIGTKLMDRLTEKKQLNGIIHDTVSRFFYETIQPRYSAKLSIEYW
jgi:GNAT superfamily N-acetyltransferase